MTGQMIDGKKLVFVSILRAGNGISDGVLSVVPGARVGHIGLYRESQHAAGRGVLTSRCPKTWKSATSWWSIRCWPPDKLAAAVTRLKACRPKSIKFLCLLTCPEGINTMYKAHPDVPIFTAAIDRELNDHGYILPGPGRCGRPDFRDAERLASRSASAHQRIGGSAHWECEHALTPAGLAHAARIAHRGQHLGQFSGIGHFHGKRHPRRRLSTDLGLDADDVHFFLGKHLGDIAAAGLGGRSPPRATSTG